MALLVCVVLNRVLVLDLVGEGEGEGRVRGRGWKGLRGFLVPSIINAVEIYSREIYFAEQ